MKRSSVTIAVIAALMMTTAVDAGPKDKDNKNNKGNAAAHCPPGLAKKDPPCIPPGQVGKNGGEVVVVNPRPIIVVPDPILLDRIREEDIHAIGAHLPDRYVILFDPRGHPDWPGATYARLGDFIYLIDPDSRRILAMPDHVGNWLWNWEEVDFQNCPPGLAKKNPPCVPPGQAMKGVTADAAPHLLGEVLPADHHVLFAPFGTSGDDDGLYTRLGDSIYRIDRDSGEVLQRVGTVADLIG